MQCLVNLLGPEMWSCGVSGVKEERQLYFFTVTTDTQMATIRLFKLYLPLTPNNELLSSIHSCLNS